MAPPQIPLPLSQAEHARLRRIPNVRWLIPILLVLTLVATPSVYLLATGYLTHIPNITRRLTSAKQSVPVQAPTITPTLADCPARGLGRKASLPDLATGSVPALVYIAITGSLTAPTASKLELWNSRTKRTTLVATFVNVQIPQVLISPDGKWLLFSLGVQNKHKLEVMRIDGQDLQTLYCSTQDYLYNFSWSPDQKLVVFSDNNAQTQQETLFLLNLSSGLVRPISTALGLMPLSWADNTHLYFEYTYDPFSSPILLLANMDENQSGATGNIPGIPQFSFQFSFQQIGLDFELGNINEFGFSLLVGGRETNQILIVRCTASAQAHVGPSAIDLETYPQFGSSGILKTIYTSDSLFIAQLWAVSDTTLLFEAENIDGSGTVFPTNGLWKVNIDQQGATPLSGQQLSNISLSAQYIPGTTITPGVSVQGIVSPNQSPASRDGTLYALLDQGVNASNTPISQLFVGSLTSGAPTPAISSSGDITLAMVGWTTI